MKDDVLVLLLMRWPDEIRDSAEVAPPAVQLSEQETDGALALMDTMTRDGLEGDEFRDASTEAASRGDAQVHEMPAPKKRAPAKKTARGPRSA